MAKRKKKRSPAARRARRVAGTIFRLFATLVMVCVITGCICVCVLTVYILDYIGTIEDIDIKNIDMNFTSIIYANDKNGEPHELSRIHGKENRILVDYDDMPQHLLDVTVAAEDKRFWDENHHGVDWKRTIAAAINMLIPIFPTDQGGSTITQQLIKNATDEWAPNVERKVKEIFSALKLQQNYPKEEILAAYLNIAAFGNNINGIEAAANFYFNKNTKDLTLLESACIVSTTQAPTANNPLKPEGEKNNKKRRQFIFKTMLEMGTITQAEYDEVYDQDVNIELSQAPAQQPNSSNSWFEDHVIEEVIADLMEEQNMSYNDASKLLFRGGLQIYTTVDEGMQQRLEEMFIYHEGEGSVFPPLNNTIYPESAFIILDHHGQIKAVAGSNRPKQGNRWLDYATQEPRQPGSTMKPISAYLQGIEKDFITWSTVIDDSPIQKPGTTLEKDGYVPWPSNYYSRYDGPHTVTLALNRSVNTIPVKILDFLGPETSMRFLHDKCGMKNLVLPEENAEVNDNNLSAMAIGGTTNGVTLLELAGAYQMNANGGTFTEPTSYTLVKDSEGNTLLEADATPKRVISKETSSILNLLMQQVVVGPRGSGSDARFKGDLAKMPIAGKTGTSSDNIDQWFVGITPYYIGVTWMGFAPRRQPIDYTNHAFPTPILWRNVMEPLHEGLEVKDFEYSNNIVQKQYCTATGDLATEDCPARLTGWYKTSSIPGICTEHQGVKQSEETEEFEDEDDDDSSSRRKSSSSKKSTKSSSSSRSSRDEDE